MAEAESQLAPSIASHIQRDEAESSPTVNICRICLRLIDRPRGSEETWVQSLAVDSPAYLRIGTHELVARYMRV